LDLFSGDDFAKILSGNADSLGGKDTRIQANSNRKQTIDLMRICYPASLK